MPSQHGPRNGWSETVHEVSTLLDGPQGVNTLFAWVALALALALGRDHKCEDGCQPLGCLGVWVAWKVTCSFWSESFSQACIRLLLEAPSPSLRIDVVSCPHFVHMDQMCSQALEVLDLPFPSVSKHFKLLFHGKGVL